MEIERKVDLGRGHRLERERQIWEREIAGQNKVDLGKGHRLERERDGREMGERWEIAGQNKVDLGKGHRQ